MTIRRAQISDAPRLAALSGDLGYPVGMQLVSARVEQLLGRDAEILLVAQSDDGDVVGWVHGSERLLLESGRQCELAGLIVHADVRGRGVGRMLVAAVEAWASARGLEQISVRSNVTRADSHPFYERIGYVRVKTQHAYRKSLQRGVPA